MTLRQSVSESVKRLRFIERDPALYSRLLARVPEDELREYARRRGAHRREAVRPGPDVTAVDVDALFDLGGVVSGGAALSYATGLFATKDVDFYFNDEASYVLAAVRASRNLCLDVNWYVGSPHELHDLDVVKCDLTRDGPAVSEPCRRALDTGVSGICAGSVIYPERTAARMLKYHGRLGTRYRREEVVFFCSLYGLPREVCEELLEIST